MILVCPGDDCLTGDIKYSPFDFGRFDDVRDLTIDDRQ